MPIPAGGGPGVPAVGCGAQLPFTCSERIHDLPRRHDDRNGARLRGKIIVLLNLTVFLHAIVMKSTVPVQFTINREANMFYLTLVSVNALVKHILIGIYFRICSGENRRSPVPPAAGAEDRGGATGGRGTDPASGVATGNHVEPVARRLLNHVTGYLPLI